MFGRGRRRRETSSMETMEAEILRVEFGRFVRRVRSGGNESSSVSRTLHVRVEPPTGAAYEARVTVPADGPMVPVTPGWRLAVLVDPDDPRQLALPADPVFTAPGGGAWRPPANLGLGRSASDAALAQAAAIAERARAAPRGPDR